MKRNSMLMAVLLTIGFSTIHVMDEFTIHKTYKYDTNEWTFDLEHNCKDFNCSPSQNHLVYFLFHKQAEKLLDSLNRINDCSSKSPLGVVCTSEDKIKGYDLKLHASLLFKDAMNQELSGESKMEAQLDTFVARDADSSIVDFKISKIKENFKKYGVACNVTIITEDSKTEDLN